MSDSIDVETLKQADFQGKKNVASISFRCDRTALLIATLILLGLGIIILILLGFNTYRALDDKLNNIKHTVTTQHTNNVRTRQFLLSTIDWSTERQKTILFMRNQILTEWKRIGRGKNHMDEAYLVAEMNMIESEKYPILDPLFILAMQRVESSFLDTVVSHAGALGINQLMPTTGKLLCQALNISYNRSLLFDVKISTQLAAKLLDILYSIHEEPELVLADYNGGPWQAYYWRVDRKRLDPETSGYVPSVMKKWQEYRELYKTYKVDEEMK